MKINIKDTNLFDSIRESYPNVTNVDIINIALTLLRHEIKNPIVTRMLEKKNL